MTYEQQTEMRELRRDMWQYCVGGLVCAVVNTILGVIQILVTELILSTTLVGTMALVLLAQILLTGLAIRRAVILRRVKSRA